MGRVNSSADTVELIVPDLGPAAGRAVIVSWSKRAGDRVAVDEPICRLVVGDLEFEVHSTADGELTRIFAEQGAEVLERSSLAEVAVEGEREAGPAQADAPGEAPEPPGAGADEATDAPKPRIESIEAAPIDPEFAPVDPVVEPPPVQIPSEPLDADAPPDTEAPAREPPPTPAEPVPPTPEPVPPMAEPTPSPPAPDAPEPLPTGDDVDWSKWISPVVQMLADERGIDLAEVRGTGIGGRIRKRDVLRHAESSGSAGDG
jgi:pyruvate dehydrogenase E2 component (dihydrolipoamide acetyltransferase)